MLITIGRQYGAGGREVAEILAKELQIPLYDRKLIALIAEHLEKGCNLEELNLTYTNLYVLIFMVMNLHMNISLIMLFKMMICLCLNLNLTL